ncbi:hypothetical protein C943_02693 [Mariniradius saccharolyticus AK6]|uniref:Uncharacterized protein n=1 Tax=Mariniradius saccharolyticus AK6 TaxID=1239962 RepID=M7X8F5_9BACT|nr:hypothetical protein C943_02693 [Mariniradius saccharolyticus AK6]
MQSKSTHILNPIFQIIFKVAENKESDLKKKSFLVLPGFRNQKRKVFRH